MISKIISYGWPAVTFKNRLTEFGGGSPVTPVKGVAEFEKECVWGETDFAKHCTVQYSTVQYHFAANSACTVREA